MKEGTLSLKEELLGSWSGSPRLISGQACWLPTHSCSSFSSEGPGYVQGSGGDVLQGGGPHLPGPAIHVMVRGLNPSILFPLGLI